MTKDRRARHEANVYSIKIDGIVFSVNRMDEAAERLVARLEDERYRVNDAYSISQLNDRLRLIAHLLNYFPNSRQTVRTVTTDNVVSLLQLQAHFSNLYAHLINQNGHILSPNGDNL